MVLGPVAGQLEFQALLELFSNSQPLQLLFVSGLLQFFTFSLPFFSFALPQQLPAPTELFEPRSRLQRQQRLLPLHQPCRRPKAPLQHLLQPVHG